MQLPRGSNKVFAVLVVLLIAGCGGGDSGSDVTTGSATSTGSATADSGTSRPTITIQGRPGTTVAAGQNYSFQPAASGGNAGGATFSAANLPAWLALDAATGRLTGTPSAADVGTYTGVSITVADGSSTATLGPFAITVSAMGSGTASLSWMPPSANSDGSALLDLSGFVVLYGSSPADLTQTISIDNPSVTTYVVENLTSGTWYFAVQAANSRGARSELSSVARKTIG
jgi:Putative Ig domain